MLSLKPTWLLQKELPSKLLKVGTQLSTPPSSCDDLIELLDRVGSLLSQVSQSPPKSIQDALEPLQGILISEVLLNHANDDVRDALSSCLSELILITAPDPPFDDASMKKVFMLIVSSFQNLEDTSSLSYHKRLHVLRTMAKVRSYLVMLDLECDALVLDIFHYFLASIRDYHPPIILSHMKSILCGLLVEFLVSMLYDAQNAREPHIARSLCTAVLDNCASQVIRFPPFVSVQIENRQPLEVLAGQIIGSECLHIAEIESGTPEEKYLEAIEVPTDVNFQFCHLNKDMENSTGMIGYTAFFLPEECFAWKKLHPIIQLLLFLEKVTAVHYFLMCEEVNLLFLCWIFLFLHFYKIRGRVFCNWGISCIDFLAMFLHANAPEERFFQAGENDRDTY